MFCFAKSAQNAVKSAQNEQKVSKNTNNCVK